jgi:hypothetical protein
MASSVLNLSAHRRSNTAIRCATLRETVAGGTYERDSKDERGLQCLCQWPADTCKGGDTELHNILRIEPIILQCTVRRLHSPSAVRSVIDKRKRLDGSTVD